MLIERNSHLCVTPLGGRHNVSHHPHRAVFGPVPPGEQSRLGYRGQGQHGWVPQPSRACVGDEGVAVISACLPVCLFVFCCVGVSVFLCIYLCSFIFVYLSALSSSHIT